MALAKPARKDSPSSSENVALLADCAVGSLGGAAPQQREGGRRGRRGQDGTSGHARIPLHMGFGGIGKAIAPIPLPRGMPLTFIDSGTGLSHT